MNLKTRYSMIHIPLKLLITFTNVGLRSWCGNANAQKTIGLAMKRDPRLVVTLPHHVKDHSVVEKALEH